MKVEWWRMKYEGGGWWVGNRQTSKQMNKQTDICHCRVAFAIENSSKKYRLKFLQKFSWIQEKNSFSNDVE